MDRWHKAAGHKAEDNARREVVFSEPVAQLEVLIEHCTQGEGNRLESVSVFRGDVWVNTETYLEVDVRNQPRRARFRCDFVWFTPKLESDTPW